MTKCFTKYKYVVKLSCCMHDPFCQFLLTKEKEPSWRGWWIDKNFNIIIYIPSYVILFPFFPMSTCCTTGPISLECGSSWFFKDSSNILSNSSAERGFLPSLTQVLYRCWRISLNQLTGYWVRSTGHIPHLC